MASAPGEVAPRPRLEVLRGARAGLVVPVAGDFLTLGRGAECDLRLDPEGDLEVSSRHAAILRRGDGWCVRDLGSRNGTFLNGAAVTEEAAIRDGDVVALGANGPLLRFHAGAGPPAAAPGAPARSHVPLVLGAVIALFALAASAFLYLDHASQRRWERERTAMQLQLDSLRYQSERAEAALHGQVAGLTRALRGTRGSLERLNGQLASADARGDRAAVAGIRREVNRAGKVLGRQQRAASLDFSAIEKANRRATAVIYVELADGKVATATAFAILPDATMLTNRHAVLGDPGAPRPRRIAIQFSDSEQVFPARLVATLDSLDLAAVKVEKLEGEVPTVRGLDLRPDTLPAGAPVALIGFPGGGQTPLPARTGGAPIVRPILGAGVLRAVAARELEVEGYGAEGASGSPIFDSAGAVVGVLFGGRQEAGGQVLYAVPASAVARLLTVLRGVSSR